MHRPRAPQPSASELYIRQRQSADLNKLDVQENARKKAISRGRLGMRQLLSGEEVSLADYVGTNVGGSSVPGKGGRRVVVGGGIGKGGGGGSGGGGGIPSGGGSGGRFAQQ